MRVPGLQVHLLVVSGLFFVGLGGVLRWQGQAVLVWGTFGLLGAMVLLLGIWLHRAIVLPVQAMTRTARKVEAGDLSARTGNLGAGEIADLSSAFDAMTEQLTMALHNREIFWQRTPMAQLRIDENGRLLECNPTGRKTLSILGVVRDAGFDLSRHPQLAAVASEVLQTRAAWSGQLQVGEGDLAYFWDCLVFWVEGKPPAPVVLAMQLLEITGQVRRQRKLEDENRARAEDLARALSELQALDRAKTEFLSLISHELRTPLNVITGYSAMLAEGALGTLDRAARSANEHVQEAGEQLLKLVNDLLDVTRLEAGALQLRPEPFDFAALVQDVLYEQGSEAELNGIALVTAIPWDLPPVWADPYRTAQILENLLSNAVKFSRSGDRVTVRAYREDHQVVTEVSDTGPGIPAAALPKLFGRFYQVA